MGNKNSVQTHLDLVDINTNYIPDMKHTDTRFGEIKLLRRRETGEKIFQKDFTSNSANDFEDYVNKIRKRVPLVHPNILKILGYNSKKEDLLCADFFKLSVFFEGFDTDLEKEIYSRSETKNYYSETELRCLLDSIIAACAYLERNQIAHSDLRPFNIFIAKGREYKVCDNALFQPLYNPSYFGILDGLEAKSHYPSPQVFKHYKNQEKTAGDFNIYKNDVYGLGMTMLSAAQLKHADDAYDYKTRKVRQEVIEESLRNLKGRYSEGFVEAIRVLLSPEEAGRPSFIELDEEIRAYRSDIRAKANLERTLEAQRRNNREERTVRSPNRNVSQTGASHYIADDETDQNVRRAIEHSESVINSRSPSKLQNQALDSHIHTYLRREPIPGDKPLLYNVAPHLRMNERFVPTLKVYQNNQQESQQGTFQTQLFDSRYPNHPAFGGEQTAHTYNPRDRLAVGSRDDGHPTIQSAIHSGQIGAQNIISPYTNANTSYHYGSYGQDTNRIVESAGYRPDARIVTSAHQLSQNFL